MHVFSAAVEFFIVYMFLTPYQGHKNDEVVIPTLFYCFTEELSTVAAYPV